MYITILLVTNVYRTPYESTDTQFKNHLFKDPPSLVYKN